MPNNDLEIKLQNLPQLPGVYQFKDATGKVIYVGKAKNLRSRVRSYFVKSQPQNPKLTALVSKIHDIEVIVTPSEVEALILEANLIKKLKPRYNVSLKDDKSYPYIAITNEPFPRVFSTRKIKMDGTRYFGPYTDAYSLKQTLKLIRDVFMVRSCKYYIDDEVIQKRKIKVCLDYHIKKCGGPCEGLVSKEEYNKMIEQVIQLINGKIDDLVKSLKEQMEKLASELRFEEAAILRDKIKALEIYTSKQSVVSIEPIDRDIFAIAHDDEDACAVLFKIRDGKLIGSQQFFMTGVAYKEEKEMIETLLTQYYLNSEYVPSEILIPEQIEEKDSIEKWLSERKNSNVKIRTPENEDESRLMSMCKINARYHLDEYRIQKMKAKEKFAPSVLRELQKELHLDRLPRRIECFDISNIQGSDIVASVVVFENGKPKKSEYRKFKIKSVSGKPDDFTSMEEVIMRRYSRVLNEGGKMPDLILIDGGKGQLSSALKSLEKLGIKNQPIIALAKKFEEIYFPNLESPQSLPKSSPALYLLQRIRNEAHRFAITFHREVRAKRILSTRLLEVKGIGEKKAQILLSKFGSIEGIKQAPIDELEKILGKTVARNLKEFLSKEE
ncbi:MAG: excinuclease ABC subunit UvrC [Candidatus Kryptonium sp.]